MQIDHPAFRIFRYKPRLGPSPPACADHDGLAIFTHDDLLTGKPRMKEVLESCDVSDNLREYFCLWHGLHLIAAALKFISQLRVQRYHVDPLGLSIANRDRSLFQVNVSPPQSAKF